MLETLRERLLEPAEAYPHAADIASVQLNLANGRITMQAQIHAALGTVTCDAPSSSLKAT